jgi:predicted phage terminase large subunit-like protein
MFEAGMILLPDDAEWADDYIESMTRFPKGQHDDDVELTEDLITDLSKVSRTLRHCSEFSVHLQGQA